MRKTPAGGDKAKTGKQGAFGLFVSRYEPMMFRTADEILHNFHDSEEAVYAALTAIARRFSSVSVLAPSEQASYAYRAARNHALNVYKKRLRREKHEIPLGELPETGECDAELERIAGSDRVTEEDIYEQMKNLPALYRDALLLHYSKGMDTKAIARELGIKHESAKTRLKRGKKMLAELLEKEFDLQWK